MRSFWLFYSHGLSSVLAMLMLLCAVPAQAAFQANGDGTVTDTVNGLMWDQCSWGQSAGACAGAATGLAWDQALGAAVSANGVNHRNHNDWRLPNKNELESLVDVSRFELTIDTAAFPNTATNIYWSSTNYTRDPAAAWFVNFADGNLGHATKTAIGFVRLVRGGQPFDAFDSQWAAPSISSFGAAPASGVYGGSAILTATPGASSAALVYGSTTPGICTVSGNVVHFGGVGVCKVSADQSGDATHNNASQATLDIPVVQAGQAITGFAATPTSVPVGGAVTLSASGGVSGNAVIFGSSTTGICSVSGNQVSILGAGTCIVTANQAGNLNYSAAPQLTLQITANLTAQSIVFAPLANQIMDQPAPVLSATASSGLPVSFASLTSGVCTVSGNSVSLVGAGVCTLRASQGGNAIYAVAMPVEQSFTVAPGAIVAPAAPIPVPALADWAMLWMIALLAMMGMARAGQRLR